MRRFLSLTMLVVLATMIAACGGAAATPAPSAGAPAPTAAVPAGTGATVAIADFSFTPSGQSVGVGKSVLWTNNGDATHSVKWSDSTPESNRMTHGQTYSRTFSAAGTFTYVCGIHSSMTGTIIVTQ